MSSHIRARLLRLLAGGVLSALFAAPAAHARGITLDIGQKNAQLFYSFSIGSESAKATDIVFGVWADSDRNAIFFARAAVFGQVSGTGEGWRIGGGGQFNYTLFNERSRTLSTFNDPEPHSIDLYIGSSYTFGGKVPIVLGFDINYSPEVLSFGTLENKLAYYSYVNFELLPSFVMRLGYQGHNFYFDNERIGRKPVIRLANRFFLGIDVRF